MRFDKTGTGKRKDMNTETGHALPTHVVEEWLDDRLAVGPYVKGEVAFEVVGDPAEPSIVVPATIRNKAKQRAELIVSRYNAHSALVEAAKQCVPWRDLIKQNYPEMVSLIDGLDSLDALLSQLEAN